MTKRLLLAILATGCLIAARGDVFSAPPAAKDESWFDFGVDERIRQEVMHNVPTPVGAMSAARPHGRAKTKNQLRFRTRVWGELKPSERLRLYVRLADECRAGLVQKTHAVTWPGEVVVDNLYLDWRDDDLFTWDAIDLSGIDVRLGREDIRGLFGLDHLFSDGTAGDGSRTLYSDVARVGFRFGRKSRLDLFALLNKDREYMRLGTRRSYNGTQLTGFGGNDTEMDDWGYGAIWSDELIVKGFYGVDYQLFAIQKNTASFHRRGEKHPRRQVNLLGAKLVPQWTANFSTPLEAMVQVGENGADEELNAWAGYVGFAWTDSEAESWRPFVEGGLLALSGDRDARTQDGGRRAWDPMWYRFVDDSEMMLYGTNYGMAWWSNMYNLKASAGVEFAKGHGVRLTAGPMFAQAKDGIGGGEGMYKGFLTQARYDFPLWSGAKDSGLARLKLFGHLLVEWFNPGDYFATDKPAYFVRWQIDFKF